MEQRLIDANALKEDFADMREGYPIFSDTEMLSTKDIAKVIDSAPTVDKGYDFGYADGHGEGYELGKNSRPQGEWILKETDCDDGGNNRYECSNCTYTDIHADSAEVHYCWHCGAKMRGTKNDKL